ncbi:type IV pilus assembly protein PilO [Oryzomicrobium terrae]|uniref:Type IV pilus assembly protein PilO n=1 Tax=Oryzomicrobium terrae TaxID=1735038 RepID=A0A5C1E673_9RHOO|nr:type 4a pilus biogenesis protein PilO [Oryzomicrobium terrae]QEL63797.1 type IV pilus assembly protein PilO [Oryzomicrobium terrae]
MKAPALPPINMQEIAGQFRNLNPNDPGAWPLAPRIALLVGVFIALLVAGWWFLWSDQLTELDGKREELEKLKTQFIDKKKQAVNLDLYTQQLAEIDRSFGTLLKQLPNKAEVESLLVEVNQAGLGRGLQFDLFKPGSETVKDFYAELPIQLKIVGNYHDFGAFAADIAKLPRIVTLSNMSITPQPKDGSLVLDTTARTYRYLDDSEVASQRRAGQGGKK